MLTAYPIDPIYAKAGSQAATTALNVGQALEKSKRQAAEAKERRQAFEGTAALQK
jgi:hypothetical protein